MENHKLFRKFTAMRVKVKTRIWYRSGLSCYFSHGLTLISMQRIEISIRFRCAGVFVVILIHCHRSINRNELCTPGGDYEYSMESCEGETENRRRETHSIIIIELYRLRSNSSITIGLTKRVAAFGDRTMYTWMHLSFVNADKSYHFSLLSSSLLSDKKIWISHQILKWNSIVWFSYFSGWERSSFQSRMAFY